MTRKAGNFSAGNFVAELLGNHEDARPPAAAAQYEPVKSSIHRYKIRSIYNFFKKVEFLNLCSVLRSFG
jgi:hypothetical protein